ncbi:hypothetical protein [Amycolatopsis magusensis]|uniref:hypothetical protein n=1 Tax=Amycolatopsis magusensis TaxID=882444 RepID=UPI00379104C1
MLISFCSLSGSPGVSTAALALGWTWPRHALVAECDPAGGRGLAVFDPAGALGSRSVFDAMLGARSMPMQRALWNQAITLPDGTGRHFLLAGAQSRRQAESLDWQRLAAAFGELDPVDILADCGRLRGRGTPNAVLAASDFVVVVVRNDRHSLHTLISSLDVVNEETGLVGHRDDGLAVLLVHPHPGLARPFAGREVAKQLEVPVVGELPWHPATAAQFSDAHMPGRKFESSPLLVRAEQLTKQIGRRALVRSARLRQDLLAPRRSEDRPVQLMGERHDR